MTDSMIGSVTQFSPIAVITAGGSHLGAALACGLAAEGARVALLDGERGHRRSQAVLRRVGPDHHIAIRCRVDREEDIRRAFGAVVSKWGRIDILVNNAQVEGPTCRAERISRKEWEETIRMNLTGAFLCAREAIPLMNADGGSIVQIGSVGGRMAYTLRLPYSVSIAALGQLTRVLAAELGPRSIRVNSVLAGPIVGPMVDEVVRRRARVLGRSEAAVRNTYRRASVMGKMVSLADVVSLVCFVCSPAGSHITGQTLEVSAGWMAELF
jgi:NAD(P)-dependent dehydrogenase (short-subunit alcohol dehydrogenase family)